MAKSFPNRPEIKQKSNKHRAKIKTKSPKSAPRAPQESPRATSMPQNSPKSGQDRPKSDPRAPQERPKATQERAKSAQERPKNHPKAPYVEAYVKTNILAQILISSCCFVLNCLNLQLGKILEKPSFFPGFFSVFIK